MGSRKGQPQQVPSTRGKGTFKVVFFLIVVTGVAAWAYPILQVTVPELTAPIDQFRGYYGGPDFLPLPPGRTGFEGSSNESTFTVDTEPQEFFFVPAAGVKYLMAVTTEYNQNVVLELVDPATRTILDANTRHEQFSGRRGDMYAPSGNDSPYRYAVGMTVPLQEGREYSLRAYADTADTVGRQATVRLRTSAPGTDVFVLWGVFSGVLLVGAVVFLIATSRG
ncbi:MAG: hypothetical protein WD492_09220 [Alkalispirochaeta sp.]